MKTSREAKKKKPAWVLQLYVADTTPRSLLAAANLRSLCEQYLQEGYQIRIIDIMKEPVLALRNDVIATPTLIRVLPAPRKKMIGSLSNAQAVLRGLDLRRAIPGRPRSTQPIAFVQEAGAA